MTWCKREHIRFGPSWVELFFGKSCGRKRDIYISTGAGFLPSTVSLRRSSYCITVHQLRRCLKLGRESQPRRERFGRVVCFTWEEENFITESGMN